MADPYLLPLTLSGATVHSASNVGTVVGGIVGAVPVDVATGPLYVPLDFVSKAPLAIYSQRRLVPGYNGSLFKMRRADNVYMEAPAVTGSDFVDDAAREAWRLGADITIDQRYDQTGNGRHEVAPYPGQGPYIYEDAKVAGCVLAGFAYQQKIVAPVPIDRRNVTVIQVMQQASSDLQMCLWEARDANDAVIQQAYPDGGVRLYNPTDGDAGVTDLGVIVNENAGCYAQTMDATERRFFGRGKSAAIASPAAAGAGTKFQEGVFSTGGQTYFYSLATLVYPALTYAETQKVITRLNRIFGLQPKWARGRMLIFGDSIAAGRIGTSKMQTLPYQITKLDPTIEIINLSISGITQADRASANYPAGLFTDPDYAPERIVSFIQSSTNDFGLLGTHGDALYANTTLPFVAKLKGYDPTGQVRICTTLPRADSQNFPWSSDQEGYRLDYNARVRANASGAPYAVVDLADPTTIMGALTAPNDPSLYLDKLHPGNPHGQELLAPKYVAAMPA